MQLVVTVFVVLCLPSSEPDRRWRLPQLPMILVTVDMAVDRRLFQIFFVSWVGTSLAALESLGVDVKVD